jgi:hypothetical protein
MSKHTIKCQSFKPWKQNTLCGFAEILINEMRLTVRDVALHQKGDRRWAQLPAKPLIGKDGAALKDETTGKTRYAPIMTFDNRDVADAFSAAVIAAVLARVPGAFDDEIAQTPAPDKSKPLAKELNDEIPF